jgi:hypothetical protein
MNRADKQFAYVTARLDGRSVAEAGATVGLKPRGSRAMETRAPVQDALRRAVAEQLATAGKAAAEAAGEAVETVKSIMRSEGIAPGSNTRLRAAELLLSYASGVHQSSETEELLARLEAEVEGLRGQGPALVRVPGTRVSA